MPSQAAPVIDAVALLRNAANKNFPKCKPGKKPDKGRLDETPGIRRRSARFRLRAWRGRAVIGAGKSTGQADPATLLALGSGRASDASGGGRLGGVDREGLERV